jgi:signal transduction histidine kinase
MNDLSLHIMDIVENSVSASATEIFIEIQACERKNQLKISICDNGIGMDDDQIMLVQDPFFTTKNFRPKKVGLGIPLFKQSVEMCDGSFSIFSKKGESTCINAVYRFDHIDRMPLGNLADTFSSQIFGHADLDFIISLCRQFRDGSREEFDFDTREIKKELGDIPITYPDVMLFIRQVIEEGIKKIELEEI